MGLLSLLKRGLLVSHADVVSSVTLSLNGLRWLVEESLVATNISFINAGLGSTI